MPPQAPWSPTAHAFAQHQFSHVANFWRQGRSASFQLEALPGGHAKLSLTFQLPPASTVVPPPTHVSPVSTPQRPIRPLFPKGRFPQGSDAVTKQKKASSKQCKSSVKHPATLAATSLLPPKNDSPTQAAPASVQPSPSVQALPVSTQSAKKRPLPDSPSDPSPSNPPPLAQRIREDILIEEDEVESPEKEVLRSSPFPENSPAPFSPFPRDIPSPAPLVFTPVPETLSLNCLNCDAEMTVHHQCEDILATDSEGNWEDIESEQDLYPTLDLESDDWADKFTNSIRRFHGQHC